MLNTFRISLSCKVYRYLNFYFIVGLRINQRLYPNLEKGRPGVYKCRALVSLRVEGLKVLPPHGAW